VPDFSIYAPLEEQFAETDLVGRGGLVAQAPAPPSVPDSSSGGHDSSNGAAAQATSVNGRNNGGAGKGSVPAINGDSNGSWSAIVDGKGNGKGNGGGPSFAAADSPDGGAATPELFLNQGR
jgi:hypothetical protein